MKYFYYICTMKLNVKICVGIPASGKSSFSKQYVFDNASTKRINKDCLREMFNPMKVTKVNENFIRMSRMKLIELCLLMDRDIIVDDTNCVQEKLDELISDIKLAASAMFKQVQIEILDFQTDFDTCIERNRNRERKVEERILYFMKERKDNINFKELKFNKYTIIKED